MASLYENYNIGYCLISNSINLFTRNLILNIKAKYRLYVGILFYFVIAALVPCIAAESLHVSTTSRSLSYGQVCDISKLESCGIHEMCSQLKNGTAFCKCWEGFQFNEVSQMCQRDQPDPGPSDSSHTGIGLAVAFILVIFVICGAVFYMHRRFGLLAGVLGRLPSFRPFGSSGREVHALDDTDVNPIV